MQMALYNAYEYNEHSCKCKVALLFNHTHQSIFNYLIDAPFVLTITISANVSDMIANGIIQCV